MSPRIFVCEDCGEGWAAFGGTPPSNECPECGGQLVEREREAQEGSE